MTVVLKYYIGDKIREKFIDAEKAIKPIKTEELKKAS